MGKHSFMKYGGVSKPVSLGKYFCKRNTEAFMNSLSRCQSLNDKPYGRFSLNHHNLNEDLSIEPAEMKSSESLNMLLRSVLSDKKPEEVPLLVEAILSIVMQEFECRIANQNEMSNGKNALHFASRQGHIDIVKALLDKDPQLARRTDKKGQTALHMAVKGTNSDVVTALVDADPAIVMLPDKFGNTALHVATRKKRAEIVNVLLFLPDTHVNALTRDHKTAFDIADNLPLSEEAQEIKEYLSRSGAVKANELNQPRDELRKIVTEIKKPARSTATTFLRTRCFWSEICQTKLNTCG